MDVKPVVQQAKVALPKDLDVVPTIAFPTVLLALCSVSAYGGAHYAYNQGWIPYSVFLPVATLAAYVGFTPAHDATHSAIASRHGGFRWLNETVGWLTTLPLCAAFPVLRTIHLRHHKYTNVAGADPDLWASGVNADGTVIPWYFIPLRWNSTVFAYVYHYLKGFFTEPDSIYKYVTFLIILTLQSFLVLHLIPGQTPDQQLVTNYLFWCCYVPAHQAIAILACMFDYIPHRPGTDTDMHKASLVTVLAWSSGNERKDTKALLGEEEEENTGVERLKKNGSFRKQKVASGGESKAPTSLAGEVGGYVTAPLSVLTLYQNYHLIHHLYPWIPFYKYSTVWYRLEGQLRGKGAAVKKLLPLFA